MAIDKEDKFRHHNFLADILEDDLKYVTVKDRSYGASWKKRGGVGAFMMLARKWDRLENMMQEKGVQYNIFRCIEIEGRIQGEDGTALAEIRDLRRYLLLVEAEMMAQGHVLPPPQTVAQSVPLEDSNKHALQPQDEE